MEKDTTDTQVMSMTSRDVLSDILRQGAQQMLAMAVENEVVPRPPQPIKPTRMVSLPAANILPACAVKAAALTTAEFLMKSRRDSPPSARLF
jgi:hypothetical protein